MIRNLFILFSVLLLSLSCSKIQSRFVMKGEWELHESYINGNYDINAQDLLLEHHGDAEDCCHYYIYYEDDGVCYGRYYTYDTLNYEVQGTWSLDERNVLKIALDKYIDGTFEVDRTKLRHFTLYDPANNIPNFPGTTNELEMRVERIKD